MMGTGVGMYCMAANGSGSIVFIDAMQSLSLSSYSLFHLYSNIV